ncbi:hypothetical protein DFH28DRAFT_956786 [Melampsora americana]|nr:hypothetical protein DFH28DRAFT_956786 [Melampsora americana]
MHKLNSLLLQISLVLAYCGTIRAAESSKSERLFDFKLTSEMKSSDVDDPKSTLSKLIKYVVKGEKKKSEYLSIESKKKEIELGIEIKDSSIFCPGDKADNCQHGFRRTDVLPSINGNKTFTGTTVFHQSFRFNPKLPINITHGYLLSSIEIPVSGDHVFDIFAGSDFSSNLTQPSMNDPKTIRIRDLTTKVLHSIPIKNETLYNTAIAIDWDENKLTVYASQGDEELKKVAGPVKNDPKAIKADIKTTGEWHVQLIKFPLPNPADPFEKRKDVVHKGLQEKNLHEGVFFSRMFVEDGTKGKITTSVEGKATVSTVEKKTTPKDRY